MASLTMVFPPVVTVRATGQVYAATAAKGGSKEEKGLFDWILGGLAKEDQLLEVDPILKKVEDKNGSVSGGKGTVVVPPKKKEGGFGGFGGLLPRRTDHFRQYSVSNLLSVRIDH